MDSLAANYPVNYLLMFYYERRTFRECKREREREPIDPNSFVANQFDGSPRQIGCQLTLARTPLREPLDFHISVVEAGLARAPLLNYFTATPIAHL